MTIIFLVAAILGFFLVFAILKKIIKWMIILTTLLMMTLVGGWLFLSGDGSMTEQFLPENVQNKINTVRDNTNTTIKTKAEAVKDAATQKVNEATEKAVKKVEDGVKSALENGTQNAKEQLNTVVHDSDEPEGSQKDGEQAASPEDNSSSLPAE